MCCLLCCSHVFINITAPSYFPEINTNRNTYSSLYNLASSLIPLQTYTSTMESLRLIHLFFFFLVIGAASANDVGEEFIRTSCAKTNFPGLCFRSLSPHATAIRTSPTQLVGKALTVALSGARTTSMQLSTMSKTKKGMREIQAKAMKDCVENVRTTVEELRKSIKQMDHLGGQSLGFQINNMQTWVSAALTGANTCLDGFSGKSMDGSLKNEVRVKISHLAKLTSNALALVNQLVA